MHTPIPALDLTCTNLHTSRGTPIWHFQKPFLYLHTSRCRLKNLVADGRHIHTRIPISTLDCFHKHTFLFHAYRNISLARLQHYTQLAYVIHLCGTSLLSREGPIAASTVRHPGVEYPFSGCCVRNTLVLK